MRLFYSALWWLLLPVVLLRLWRRGRKEPGYRQHIGERLGCYHQFARRVAPPLIWVHAVSVGETRAAQPLVEALLCAYPQHTVLLTHMSATGRATGKQLFAQHGERVVQSFFPYDTGWMCGRFLAYFKPRICILMETEVWPNMMRQCLRYRVPVMLANARLSARSLRRGRRFGALLRQTAGAIACVAAQAPADAARLRQFGAGNVTVTGNIKFDIAAPAALIALGQHWRTYFGRRRVLLCASTRAGEEQLILDALGQIDHSHFLTVIVPRHPQRFDQVAAMIQARGFALQRRSSMTDQPLVSATSVILGDSMGEMFAYYAACDVAFIGGSLLAFGGQNLIEACVLGKPVLIGPHTFNFEAISAAAVEMGAALRVSDAAAMLQAAQALFEEGERSNAMAQAGLHFAQQHQGATQRTMTLIAAMLGF